MAPFQGEAAKAALEKARAALATRQRLAESLAKLKKVHHVAVKSYP